MTERSPLGLALLGHVALFDDVQHNGRCSEEEQYPQYNSHSKGIYKHRPVASCLWTYWRQLHRLRSRRYTRLGKKFYPLLLHQFKRNLIVLYSLWQLTLANGFNGAVYSGFLVRLLLSAFIFSIWLLILI